MDNYGRSNQTATLLPECNNLTDPKTSTNTPCWAIETDTANCTGGDHLTLTVERGGTTPGDKTHVVSYCVTEATDNGSGN